MKRHCRWRILGGLWSILVLLNTQTTLAQTDSQNKPLDVICLTERPAVAEGGSTNLQVWATTRDGDPLAQPVSFAWQASEGTIQGSGSEVQWNLSGVSIAPGELHKKVTATVKAAATGLGEASCAVEVFIGKKDPAGGENSSTGTRGGLITGRRYLLPDETELSGYGLYSYLLLSAKPQNEEETKRYLKTLEASLQMMNKLQALGRHVRPGQLNATHIPVTELPKGKEDDPDFAKKVLAVYDFARAQVLLNKFEKTYDRDPYLISVKPPLTQASEPVPFHILQNFTGAVPDLAARGVRDFEFLAAQERTWTEQSMRVLAFKARNLVAIAGKETPKVAGGLKAMIQFIKLGE
jgi:hypothetical protein